MDRIIRLIKKGGGEERREYTRYAECSKNGFCNDGRKGYREIASGKKRPTKKLPRTTEGIGFRADKIVDKKGNNRP